MAEERPDGALSTWRWMWRALERSSSSRWRLRMRFAAHVAGDAVLLAAWYVTRLPRRLARSPKARVAVVAVGVAVSGFAVWVHNQPHRARWPVAKIEIAANGILTVQGQAMSLEDFRTVTDHYRINVAQVTMAPDAAYRLVVPVIDALKAARTPRIVLNSQRWGDRHRPR